MHQHLVYILIIIQFPLICLCHDDVGAFRDVILSPKDFGGKYVKFNHRLVEISSVPWEEPLKESVKIALSGSLNFSKDLIFRAQYLGMKSQNPPINAFGDIVIMAKGKLKKSANDSLSFEEIHDVCEFECQNNADKYLENVIALWMVERIRHRDNVRGYRYDLRFTIVPINSYKSSGRKSNNLEERLRNQLKKTFILRDTDYPKYFQNIAPKIMRRADHFDRNAGMSEAMNHHQHHPNRIVHHHINFPQTQKVYSSNERLNIGEYLKKPFSNNNKAPSLPVAMKSASFINNYYLPNVNQRYPIRFPDSRETHNIMHKNLQYRIKPLREEEKQEAAAQSVVNIVDHRGAIELSGKQQQQPQPQQQNTNNNNFQSKPQAIRTTSLFMHQPAIAFPIIVPQMPMSLLHVAPYTIPLHLQLSTPSNQVVYSQQQQNQPQYQQQPDITTFRYPISLINLQNNLLQQQQKQNTIVSQNISTSNKTIKSSSNGENRLKNFKTSEVLSTGQSFSLPDPLYHSTTASGFTTERPIQPTQYSPRGNNYATAASIQINSYENNDFQPIDPPPYSISKNKKPLSSSESKQHVTTDKSKFSSFKNYENNPRYRQSVKERVPKPLTTIPPSYSPHTPSSFSKFRGSGSNISDISTASSTIATYSESIKIEHSYNSNHDAVTTRPSITKRTTTEKPILKWLPKKHRNKTLSSYTIAYPIKNSTTVSSTFSVVTSTSGPFIVTPSSIEAVTDAAVPIHSNAHPTIKASTHAQVFRGKNRFYYGNKRNSSTSTSSVTEKSTKSALSSTVTNQTLKLLKRKSTSTAPATALLPITTKQPTSLITTTAIMSSAETTFPTLFVTSSPSYETIEPISSNTTPTNMYVDNEQNVDEEREKLKTTSAYSSYEVVSAGVETIKTNSSNIQLYKAEADEGENENLKIDEIASSIINHAKSTENDEKK